jgi:hypothetical protein
MEQKAERLIDIIGRLPFADDERDLLVWMIRYRLNAKARIAERLIALRHDIDPFAAPKDFARRVETFAATSATAIGVPFDRSALEKANDGAYAAAIDRLVRTGHLTEAKGAVAINHSRINGDTMKADAEAARQIKIASKAKPKAAPVADLGPNVIVLDRFRPAPPPAPDRSQIELEDDPLVKEVLAMVGSLSRQRARLLQIWGERYGDDFVLAYVRPIIERGTPDPIGYADRAIRSAYGAYQAANAPPGPKPKRPGPDAPLAEWLAWEVGEGRFLPDDVRQIETWERRYGREFVRRHVMSWINEGYGDFVGEAAKTIEDAYLDNLDQMAPQPA